MDFDHTKIEMKPVTGKDGKPSTNIGKAGYDPATKTFKIYFLSGGTYLHHDVPQDVYDDWQAADSKGGAYHRTMKRFRHTKV